MLSQRTCVCLAFLITSVHLLLDTASKLLFIIILPVYAIMLFCFLVTPTELFPSLSIVNVSEWAGRRRAIKESADTDLTRQTKDPGKIKRSKSPNIAIKELICLPSCQISKSSKAANLRKKFVGKRRDQRGNSTLEGAGTPRWVGIGFNPIPKPTPHHLSCSIPFKASVTGEEQTVSSPGCQLWKSQRTELTLTLLAAHPLLYKHTQSLCANGKTSAVGVCGHVCGETGGYLEQRQTLGVRNGPGWTLQLCVCVPKGQGLAC
ncbi:hypothetical protein DPX16_21944 [Anabarilius grahami]|uniref:Uncharacterized protein n=1 Tax=Anabarilius grahami TaxID=495550 RepID=A0A3N0XP61_ANAGA|nr:hypothetical protein DPX16_21944 [Anabarilius grahami]